MQQFIQNMASEVFDQFIQHLNNCAVTYRSQAERDQRRVLLTHLFVSCDHTGVIMYNNRVKGTDFRCIKYWAAELIVHCGVNLIYVLYMKNLNTKQFLQRPVHWIKFEIYLMNYPSIMRIRVNFLKVICKWE